MPERNHAIVIAEMYSDEPISVLCTTDSNVPFVLIKHLREDLSGVEFYTLEEAQELIQPFCRAMPDWKFCILSRDELQSVLWGIL